ncbi:MAG: phenylalanine--tRNA ligase subunit beta [Parcubacteria group bacterium]|nr:phenylalanine--tRNA ligase subunit beta [Parcubacteria group bacterium]
MKISHAWLQTYFNEPLPTAEGLAELVTFHAFEVEGIEKVDGDSVIDISVLPNRAHDCLSYEGMAREIGVLAGLEMKPRELKDVPESDTRGLSIFVEDSALCSRYMGRAVEGIEIKPSPEWLKTRLASIGQRSINNVVDIMNFVMFETGQPLHAFDADKLSTGEIFVRKAKTGEKIATLDGKDIALDENVLVIADKTEPLAIAGIKGGRKAEVANETKNIVIESANFAPGNIRKTSRKIGIRTDASARYENKITPEKTVEAMKYVVSLLSEYATGTNFKTGKTQDVYPNPQQPFTVSVSVQEVNALLGTSFSGKEIENILKKLRFEFSLHENRFSVIAPAERLDLRIKEDLIEEIGRVYAYEKIAPVQPTLGGFTPAVNKTFYYADRIRRILAEEGFSEVSTYAFTDSGDIEMENPIASDKKFLRRDLADNMAKALDLNGKNAALLGLDVVKIFEIGKVFEKEREYLSLCLGSLKKNVLPEIEQKLSEKLGVSVRGQAKGEILMIDFDALLSQLPEPAQYEFPPKMEDGKKYKRISPYPFVLRDVAVFVPDGAGENEVRRIILAESGELLVQTKLFDVFQKTFEDGAKKTSYAFRLVFQSQEKTLSDEEVNRIMENVTLKLNGNEGWRVR